MPNKRKIYFRADAGPEIGYGHYIRSLALADMLKQDFDCTMFTQTPTAYQLHETKDICPVVALPADESKFDKFLSYLQGDEIVVLDNYFYDTDYQRTIKAKGCKLVCIDDMHDKHFVADAIINSAPNVDAANYSMESYTRLYHGLEYILLRKGFLEATHTVGTERSNSVFVCFGGSDEHDLTYSTCKVLLQQPDLHIHAVVGGHYNGLKRLQSLDASRLSIHQNLNAQKMVELLSEAVFAIVPLSTTFLEACCTRTPIISGYDAENQLNMAQSEIINKMCYNCGNLFENFEQKLLVGIALINSGKGADIIEAQRCYVNDSASHLKQIFKEI